MSKVQKRVKKSKQAILSNIQLNQTATKMRDVIKNQVYPFLVDSNETISYHKLFLQSLSGLVSGVFDAKTKTVTIGELLPEITAKLNTIFTVSKPEQKKEYDRYVAFLTLVKDVSVHDLSFITDLPRYIDGYLLQDKGKEKIDVISIDKLLG